MNTRAVDRVLSRVELVQLLLNFSTAFTVRADAAALKLPLLLQEAVAVGLQVLPPGWPGKLRRRIGRRSLARIRSGWPRLRQQR